MRVKNKATNTYPLVVHACKIPNHPFILQARAIVNKSMQDVPLYSDTAICFYKCGIPGKTVVEESLDPYNIQITNIYNEVSHDIPDKAPRNAFSRRRILRSKPHALAKFLQKNKHIKYVIGWDSTDVFFLDHPNNVIDKFKSLFDAGMLFNASVNCYPEPKYTDWIYHWSKYSESSPKPVPFTYLNSGLFICKSDVYLKLYNDYKNISKKVPWHKLGGGEQGLFHRVYNNNRDIVSLDSKCMLLQCIEGDPGIYLEIE